MKVCGILPSGYKSDCDTLVDEYGPTIVQLLVKELAPDAVCKELKLCTEVSVKVGIGLQSLFRYMHIRKIACVSVCTFVCPPKTLTTVSRTRKF